MPRRARVSLPGIPHHFIQRGNNRSACFYSEEDYPIYLQCYVQYINRTYQRSATLWEGRFRSCLANEENYVLGCYRYIELNPVRAGMVNHPANYPWSSYQINAQGVVSDLIKPYSLYQTLGLTSKERRSAYRELFRNHLDPGIVGEIRQATNGSYALGSERFQKEVEIALERRVVPGMSGRPRRGD